MKRVRVAMALAFLVASTAACAAETLTGVVSDAMCAKNPAKAASPTHAGCAEKCIKGGSPAVLIVGEKVYSVTNPEKIEGFAGKTITVDGTLADGKLTVASVKE